MSRRRKNPWLTGAWILALASLLASTTWVVIGRRGSETVAPAAAYTAAHRDLLLSYRGSFPIRPRLSSSAAAAHGEPTVPTGAIHSFSGDPDPRLLAELKIEQDNEALGTPEAWAAAAARDLLAGHTERAIGALEAVRLHRPNDVRVLNDLAAAYLVRGEEEEDLLDVIDALGLAEEATRQLPELLEPYFNHALALDLLQLRSAASKAWASYLQRDPTKLTWAMTAQRRREALLQPAPYDLWDEMKPKLRRSAAAADRTSIREVVSAYPRESLDEAEFWLLSRWSEAVLSGEREVADRTLLETRAVAASLSAFGGRTVLESALEQIESVRPKGTDFALAEAYFNLAQGIAAIESFEIQRAEAPLNSALEVLMSLDSPYEARALYFLAICRYQGGEYWDAERMLHDARRLASSRNDLVTLAESLQLHAQIDGIGNRFGSALERQRFVMDLFEQLGWAGKLASLHSLHAEMLGMLGDHERAWDHRLLALKSAGWVTSPRIRVRIWDELTRAAVDRDPRVAVYFAEELIASAEESALPLAYASALHTRASVFERLGETEQALVDIGAATAWIDQLEDQSIREMLLGDVLRTRAEVLAGEDPPGALASLEEASLLYRKTDFRGGLTLALKARARSLSRTHDWKRAETDLEEALALVEDAASGQLDPLTWESLLNEARSAYDAMIELQMRMGRPGRALHYSLRSRWEPGKLFRRPSLLRTDLADVLESQGAILCYHALAEKLLIWVLREEEVHSMEVSIGRSDLIAKITSFHRVLRTGENVDSSSEVLYRLLISPVEEYIGGEGPLVVVAEGALKRVPFVVLRNPSDRRYLIQERLIVSASSLPAAKKFVNSHGGSPFDASTRILAVANPHTDPALELIGLPQTELEVRSISENFSRTTLLLRDKATKNVVLASARQHDILHYAGHVLGDDHRALLSSLVLAGDDGQDGLLFAHELITVSLEEVRLAVISGCGPGGRGSGSLGIVDSFLSSGVPSVIVSLWDVADRPTASLFGRFYKALAAGLEPAEALRHSQLQLLETGAGPESSPASWGAFYLTVNQLE